MLLLAAVLAACRVGTPDAPMPDLDGDGVAEKWKKAPSDLGGSMEGGADWTLVFSKTGEKVELGVTIPFSTMIDPHGVPKALLQPGRDAARREVELRMFENVCDAPDPSLEWLLDAEIGHPVVRWRDGEAPVMPENYTVAVTSPRLLRAFTRAGPAMIWLSYKGHWHSPARKGFEQIASAPARKLLRTAHGLVVVDTAAHRHAWAWVTRNGSKLRFPSVCNAAVTRGSLAKVLMSFPDPANDDDFAWQLEVDLETAATRRVKVPHHQEVDCKLVPVRP